jgi:RNA polymerase sigma-70 factor (ECF subfamily)
MAGDKPAAKGKAEEANERLLVEAAQADPSRFAELYELHFDKIYAFVARRLRNRDLAEDLTAEIFHKALANLPRFQWRGAPFATWLFRIASNVIADRFKSMANEIVVSEDTMSDSSPNSSRNQISDQLLEEVERRAQLFRLVRQLPDDQRLVIGMRFAEEKSIREIAEHLGRSEGAIKQLQFRGLQNLRAQLGEKNG